MDAVQLVYVLTSSWYMKLMYLYMINKALAHCFNAEHLFFCLRNHNSF